MIDYRQTVITQYRDSLTLMRLLDDWNDDIDPRAFFSSWLVNVWNIETATGYGLDLWGRIVGVSRIIKIQSGKYLGFSEADDLTEEPWNTAPWYVGNGNTNSSNLTDKAFRTLIFAKALANISDGSISSLNHILTILFSADGPVYVRDNGDLTMTYVFSFAPSDLQISIVELDGLLPTPAGVTVGYEVAS